MHNSIYGLTLLELRNFLAQENENMGNATSIFESIYKQKKKSTKQIANSSWEILRKKFSFLLPKIVKTQKAVDGTVKFLIEFPDLLRIETVLLPFHKRYTVCLSSQVGCAMNCRFCYTGTQGLSRNLTASEIISQYIVAYNYLKENIAKDSITPNIVFMGQGEPLHNLEHIQTALQIFFEPSGLHLGYRQITLSTAGYLPGLKKIHTLPPINFALSLHSPFDHIRSELIPINQHFPLKDVLEALDTIPLIKKQFITYEYLLIADLNDREVDAIELYNLLNKRRALINIIPFNPFPGSKYKRPTQEAIAQFKEYLVKLKLRTMIRDTKGDDILAACGQLNSNI